MAKFSPEPPGKCTNLFSLLDLYAMDPPDSMDVDQAATSNPGSIAQSTTNVPAVTGGGDDGMEVEYETQKRMEKRKRETDDEADDEAERDKVRVIESGPNKGMIKRLQTKISELKETNATLESEIDDVNYQLKTEISDLKRKNDSLLNEIIGLRAIDVSLVDTIDVSSLTQRESERLIPLITKLRDHIQQLEDPSRFIPADFEPSNDSEKNLLSRINQLQTLYDTALKQKAAFLKSMQKSQGEKDALQKQTILLQEVNTEVQGELRQLKTPDQQMDDLKSHIKKLLDDKRCLQLRVETLQQSADGPEHAKTGSSPNFRSMSTQTNEMGSLTGLLPEVRSTSAQTDGVWISSCFQEDPAAELKSLHEKISHVESELEKAKEESESIRKARDRVATVLKTKKEEHEKEKKRYDTVLEQAAERERTWNDEKISIENQIAELSKLRQELSSLTAERDRLKLENEQSVALQTANQNLEISNIEHSGRLASVQKELAELKDLQSKHEKALENQRQQAAKDLAEKIEDLQRVYNEKLNSVLLGKVTAEEQLKEEQTARQRIEVDLQNAKNESESRARALNETLNSLKVQRDQDILKSEQGKVGLQEEVTRLQDEITLLKVCDSHRPRDTIDWATKPSARQGKVAVVHNIKVAHTATNKLLEEGKRNLSKANAAKDVALKKLADEQKSLANLQSSYQVLKSQHQACQDKIETSEQNAADKIQKMTQATDLVKKYREDLTQARDKIQNAENSLKEKTAEIARLQEKVAELEVIPSLSNGHGQTAPNPAATTSNPSAPESAVTWFPGPHQTLGRARVTAALQRAAGAESSSRDAGRARYRLGAVIELQPTPQVPWGNQKPSRFTKTGRRLRTAARESHDDSSSDDEGTDDDDERSRNDGRGTRDPNDSDSDSSDGNESDDEEMGERDDHVVRRKWDRMGTKKKYTQQQQNINCSHLPATKSTMNVSPISSQTQIPMSQSCVTHDSTSVV
ncbi:hypothetical protein K435DRAFT_794152 [Dendrothele bispora CBS 962.96]|uniref:Uncharacterized protein n=1 Tax=Dendrothele bispora (strain CBS 962.96) TaxID=1314807 RepID=A0A4S8MDE6_DENBC|nr:hypothetical protein K435DRAFT_794152 [Dendrothele bispora CBS 962.96]